MCEHCTAMRDVLRSLAAVAARLESLANDLGVEEEEIKELGREHEDDECSCLACRARQSGGV